MKANVIKLDNVKNCKCVFHTTSKGITFLVIQCDYHKRLKKYSTPIEEVYLKRRK